MTKCVICNKEIKSFESLDTVCYHENGVNKSFHNLCLSMREQKKLQELMLGGVKEMSGLIVTVGEKCLWRDEWCYNEGPCVHCNKFIPPAYMNEIKKEETLARMYCGRKNAQIVAGGKNDDTNNLG